MNGLFHQKRRTVQRLVAASDAAPVLGFPGHSNGLSKHELHALWSVVLSCGHDWLLETETDASGDLWAVLGPRVPKDSRGAAYLVSKKKCHLRLIEAPLVGSWKLRGEYERIGDVQEALSRVIHDFPQHQEYSPSESGYVEG